MGEYINLTVGDRSPARSYTTEDDFTGASTASIIAHDQQGNEVINESVTIVSDNPLILQWSPSVAATANPVELSAKFKIDFGGGIIEYLPNAENEFIDITVSPVEP